MYDVEVILLFPLSLANIYVLIFPKSCRLLGRSTYIYIHYKVLLGTGQYIMHGEEGLQNGRGRWASNILPLQKEGRTKKVVAMRKGEPNKWF